MSRRRPRDRNPPVAPDPGGETDDHGRLRLSSSGFESSRRGHAAIAQSEERSPGTAEVPGSAPGGGSGPRSVPSPWRDWTRNGLLHRRVLVRIEPGALPATRPAGFKTIGGLTERKGARLLSEGRGQPRQRSIRCPSALEGMPRWLGHAVSKTVTRLCRGGSTPLPSAVMQECDDPPGHGPGHRRTDTDLRRRPAAIG